MGMGFAPNWVRQVSPLASENHFNHWLITGGLRLQRHPLRIHDFHRRYWFAGKCSCRLCAGYRKCCRFAIAQVTLEISGMFHVRQQSPLYIQPERNSYYDITQCRYRQRCFTCINYDIPVCTGDEVSCAACVQQRSYDNIIDNFCTADFGQLNIITHSWTGRWYL